MPQPVVESMVHHIELEARIGGYEAAERSGQACEDTYTQVAALLGCERSEIALTESATKAWTMAFYSLDIRTGQRILTSRAEYASNYLAYLHLSETRQVRIEVIPDEPTGETSVDALEQMIDEDVALISLSHVPTNGGLVNPAAAIGKVARRNGITYLLDACQSAGHLDLNVREIGCDILTGTGRKYLRGPRGTGFLYVRQELLENMHPASIDLFSAEWVAPSAYRLRPDARRFESWESSIAARIGLGEAVAYARRWGMDQIEERVRGLGKVLRGALEGLDGVTVHDTGRDRCGIVTFSLNHLPSDLLKRSLSALDMNVTVSTASSTLLDFEKRGLPDMIRASVHYYNTTEEIDRFVEAVGIIGRGAAFGNVM
jgi:cysteine desulfurase / selenocysteine lyase